MSEDHYLCPTCDSDVVVGGNCPGCASVSRKAKRRKKKVAATARKSWEQDESCDGLELPGEGFDYDEYVAQEFSSKPHRKIGIKLYWWVTAAVLLVALLWMLLGGMW